MYTKLKATLKTVLPLPLVNLLKLLRNWSDMRVSLAFVQDATLPLSWGERANIIKQLYWTSLNLNSPHTQAEILAFIRAMLALPADTPGVIVEAGCFKGSSSAKFSLAAEMVGRDFVIFDSFQGIPLNDEPHDKNIFGAGASFNQGDYCGSLDEVKSNVQKFGRIHCCRFVPGWLEETLPHFEEPVSAAYLDVDLVSSTRTCPANKRCFE